ncbi:IclR family transcriptional regulator [Haematomicrobium sanguinis]|uniref:IclR family transcriptional regulator n=1 Tax=Haematomicrobium sanguinis TaxID=479106 RepID=UPI0005588CBF|nr:IclR family transcriptional regulator [Haematomicrobium sanguinis]
MQNKTKAPIRRKPSYFLESVDNALRLVQILRDIGHLRIKDAAEELGIAGSTAHRLMAMLVYRGFAVQGENKEYLPGPAIGVSPAGLDWTRELRRVATPHLELLSSRLGETVNLMVRVGANMRFVSSVESTLYLRVGDRQGAVFGAHATSGGKAILAQLPAADVRQLYRSKGAELAGDYLDDAEFESLVAELAVIRRTGFAVNKDHTEIGVAAVGMSLSSASGEPIAAFAVACPTTRLDRLLEKGSLELMRMCAESINTALATP